MSSQISDEVYFLLYSVCMGIIITFVYDLIRLLREIIPHKNFVVAFEDVLFWIFTSLSLFLMLYKLNNGAVRWFFIAGALLGMVIYHKSLGQYMVVFVSGIIKKILHIANRFFMFVFSPIRRMLRKLKLVFMRFTQKSKERKKNTKNKLTDLIKEVKIPLCEQKKPNDREVDL